MAPPDSPTPLVRRAEGERVAILRRILLRCVVLLRRAEGEHVLLLRRVLLLLGARAVLLRRAEGERVLLRCVLLVRVVLLRCAEGERVEGERVAILRCVLLPNSTEYRPIEYRPTGIVLGVVLGTYICNV